MALVSLLNTVTDSYTSQGVYLSHFSSAQGEGGAAVCCGPWEEGPGTGATVLSGVARDEARVRSVEGVLSSPLMYAIMACLFLGAATGHIHSSPSTKAP